MGASPTVELSRGPGVSQLGLGRHNPRFKGADDAARQQLDPLGAPVVGARY